MNPAINFPPISVIDALDLPIKPEPKIPTPINVAALDLAEAPTKRIPLPVAPQTAAAALPKETNFTWLKGVFSAIVDFFRSIFGLGEDATDQNTGLEKRLTALVRKNSCDPDKWNALIDSLKESKHDCIEKFMEKAANKNRDFADILDDIKNGKKSIGLEKYERLQIKMKYEILKAIQNNPDVKDKLNKCLARLGGIKGIMAPASLRNSSNSCYMDALLQVLFASKAFIKILKNAQAANTYKDVVITLKHYCLGLEVGLQSEEISNLRNDFRAAIKNLPKGKGLDKHNGVTGQQDATELLHIIFEALDVDTSFAINRNMVKVYDLENYEIKDKNPQGLALGVRIPSIPDRELLDEQAKKAKIVQALYDTFLEAYNKLQEDEGLDKKKGKINIADELKDDINSKMAPLVTLQEVVDVFFAPEEGESEPVQGAIDKFLAGDCAESYTDPDKKAHIDQLASRFKESSTLTGDAPPLLVLVVGREIPGKRGTNSRKIEVPEDGIVHVTINDEEVAYRVVGIAGGHISTGGGHWVANAQINNQWYFVDDCSPKATPLKSPNDRLNNCGRLYVLEKVD